MSRAAPLLLLCLACPGAPPKLSAIQSEILTPTCTFSACHGPASPMRSLKLTAGASFGSLVNKASSQSGIQLVVPGDPKNSLLYQALLGIAPNTRKMPLDGMLTEAEVAEVHDWIAAGAKDD